MKAFCKKAQSITKQKLTASGYRCACCGYITKIDSIKRELQEPHKK